MIESKNALMNSNHQEHSNLHASVVFTTKLQYIIIK